MPFNPHTPKDVGDMLAAIGAKTIEDLFDEIPKELRIESLAGIPEMMAMRPSWLPDDARRVLQRLHAVPGGSLAGHAAAHL